MKSYDLVKAMIAAKLSSGGLPATRPAMTRTGMGTNEPCAACDDLITPTDVKCTCNLSVPPPLHFHVECFTEWLRQQPR